MKPQCVNPVLPGWEYVPDVEPRIFGDRLYLYGSHDRFGGGNYCLNDYVVWSAPITNFSNWQCHGTVYRTAEDPANADGAQTGFAPDCVQGKDGRFYLYYCLSRSSIVSVAVSDSPAGPFSFYGHVHNSDGNPLGGPGSLFCFDPGVLMDDDGKIWLYTGFALTGRLRTYMLQAHMQIDGGYCMELEDDMLTVKTAPVLVLPGKDVAEGTGFEGHAFYEASSPRKIGGRYYLVYSSELSHELCYAVSDTPNGGYTYGGTVVSIGDVGISEPVNYLGNTHGGLVEVGNQWYIFYHRQTNKTQFSRQCCAEQVRFEADGSIPQVCITSCGLNGGPLNGKGAYEARIACNLSSREGTAFYNTDISDAHPFFTQEGEDREQDSNQYIANLRDGAWAGFKYFQMDGAAQITVTVRGSGKGTLEVSTDQKNCIAAIEITPAEKWTAFSAPISVPDGVYPLFFTFHGEGSMDFCQFTLE